MTMTDAADKIWATIDSKYSFGQSGEWSSDRSDICSEHETSYVRTALALEGMANCRADAHKNNAALHAKIQALVNALQDVAGVAFDKPANFHATDEVWLKRRAQMMQNIALVAIQENR